MAAFSPQDLRTVEAAPAESLATTRSNPHADKLAALARAMAGSGQNVAPASRVVLEGSARVLDLLSIVATAFLTYLLSAPADHSDFILTMAFSIAVAATFVVLAQLLKLTTIGRLRYVLNSLLWTSAAWCAALATAGAAVYLLGLSDSLPHDFVLRWFEIGLLTLLVERGFFAAYVRRLSRTGRLARRTVVVGGGPAADELLDVLLQQDQTDLTILGIFDDRADERSPPMTAGLPKLGNVDDLVEFARSAHLDLVIFTLPITAEQRLLQMLRKLWVLPLDIRLAAHRNKLRFRPRAYSYIGSVPVFDVFDKPLADWDIVLKTIFDKVIGTLCLLCLAPVMLLVALAIKLDSRGPILFKQKRYGFNNELIEVYKFRSLRLEDLDYAARKLVTRNDPRVTRVGRIIRKTSLDELPQLLNVVFRGNLSLVGPRPHAINAHAADRQYDEVVDGYFARHRVRPGITGWAQIHGWRGPTDTPEKIQKRVEHDLYYIENWSIFLDAYILLATPLALLKAENAY